MTHECHTSQQGRFPCTCGCLNTDNSDGTDPHSDEPVFTFYGLMVFIQSLLAIGLFIFIIFGLIGYWSAL